MCKYYVLKMEYEMNEKLLNLNQVKNKTSRSKSVIYRLINTNDFPAPIKIGRSSVWVESEVDAWITDLIANSRAA